MAKSMKEIHGLFRKGDKLYGGQVEFVLHEEEQDSGDRVILYFFVIPNDGLYKGAKIKFMMTIDGRYPDEAPYIVCGNEIYHPNIDAGGGCGEYREICVNLLGSDWQPEVGLDGAVMAVLFLFYNPQLDDALSCVCCDIEWEEYVHNVFLSLRGREVGDITFDKVLEGGENDKCPCVECETTARKENGTSVDTRMLSGASPDIGVCQENGVSSDTSFHVVPTLNESEDKENGGSSDVTTETGENVLIHPTPEDVAKKETAENVSIHPVPEDITCASCNGATDVADKNDEKNYDVLNKGHAFREVILELAIQNSSVEENLTVEQTVDENSANLDTLNAIVTEIPKYDGFNAEFKGSTDDETTTKIELKSQSLFRNSFQKLKQTFCRHFPFLFKYKI